VLVICLANKDDSDFLTQAADGKLSSTVWSVNLFAYSDLGLFYFFIYLFVFVHLYCDIVVLINSCQPHEILKISYLIGRPSYILPSGTFQLYKDSFINRRLLSYIVFW